MKTTDPKLAKFLGDRVRTLSDEDLCRLVREYYKIPHPPPAAPDVPPTGGFVARVRGWWNRLYNR